MHNSVRRTRRNDGGAGVPVEERDSEISSVRRRADEVVPCARRAATAPSRQLTEKSSVARWSIFCPYCPRPRNIDGEMARTVRMAPASVFGAPL